MLRAQGRSLIYPATLHEAIRDARELGIGEDFFADLVRESSHAQLEGALAGGLEAHLAWLWNRAGWRTEVREVFKSVRAQLDAIKEENL